MSNPFKFKFFENGNLISKISFLENIPKQVSIGKRDTDIVFTSPEVSRIHAVLIYDGYQYYIQDINSSNGTFHNQKRLAPNQVVPLSEGDTVNFSGSQVYMECTAVEESSVMGNGVPANYSSIPPLASFFNNKNEISIGRSEDCDVVLSHSSISRRHATLVKTGNQSYRLTDQGSLNGTFVNGKKIRSADVGPGDNIYIGRFLLSLDNKARNLSKETAITAERVAKVYGNGFYALKETSFDVPSGALIAIMGPSGCGKSTLLKVLNGDSPATNGNVRILGLDLVSHYDYLKPQIGYVPQDDIVHRELTVEQSLYFAAKLRLDGISDEDTYHKVDRLLADLNIEKIRNNLVSKISGGQRKRVSIAVELLSDPAILFLDEPTSPLDPQTIEEFLGILKGLSQRGTTVIMVTHKPEDLDYMDSVIFMAEGGYMVFYGDKDKYQQFFNVATPVQVYASISGPNAKRWVKNYQESNFVSSPSSANPIKKSQPVDPFRQFYWLLSRYFRIKTNDRMNSVLMVAQAPIIAILICVIFKHIDLSVPFLMAISSIWFGVNNAAREIVSECAIYKRERMFNLLIFPYIFSKLFVLGTFALIQAILFNLIIFLYYDGENVSWNDPGMATLWMFTVTLGSSMFGLLISASSESVEKVMSFVPVSIIPQIMLAGVITKIRNEGIEFISYFTFSRWGTEGFCNIQESIILEMSGGGVPPTSQGDTEMQPVSQGQETFVKADAVNTLNSHFHDSYTDIFSDHASTLQLDFTMIVMLFLICLSIIWGMLKQKDSI